ncbi:MAG: c-type cytochrome [Planctomycetaceae bacterium]
MLLDGFAGQSPSVKPALLSAIFASPERINKLLDEIESGRIAARELDVTRTGQLLKNSDPAIKARAEKLLASNISSDRDQVYNDFKPALALDADPQRGREVFRRTCIQCHKIGKLGVNVAPEISDVGRTQTNEQILLSILDPNRAIDNNYFSYSVLLHDGTVHTGVIAAETATSVTLKQAEGKQVTVLRSDIDELKSNGISLMPVGVEKDIDKQQMADLVSFIKNWRYLDGAVPGVGGR